MKWDDFRARREIERERYAQVRRRQEIITEYAKLAKAKKIIEKMWDIFHRANR